jgi:site-specific recombinase XerD
VRAYQEHLIAQQVSWSAFNQAVCALRFLYNITLGRPELIAHLPFAKRPRTLPTVLSPEEVARLLEAALPGRDQALLQTTYACCRRLKELLRTERNKSLPVETSTTDHDPMASGGARGRCQILLFLHPDPE